MDELQIAYLQGVEAAREAILAELAMEEEAALMEDAALQEADAIRAAQYEELVLASMQEEEAAAIEAEYAEASLEAAMMEAYAAGAESAISPEDLRREEAYQIGVSIAEAEAMLEELKAAASQMDEDLKSNCDKGYEACRSALGQGGGSGTSKSGRGSSK